MLKILLLVIILGVVVYGTVRALQRRSSGPTPRITGPDDDPDFLRGLGRDDR